MGFCFRVGWDLGVMRLDVCVCGGGGGGGGPDIFFRKHQFSVVFCCKFLD